MQLGRLMSIQKNVKQRLNKDREAASNPSRKLPVTCWGYYTPYSGIIMTLSKIRVVTFKFRRRIFADCRPTLEFLWFFIFWRRRQRCRNALFPCKPFELGLIRRQDITDSPCRRASAGLRCCVANGIRRLLNDKCSIKFPHGQIHWYSAKECNFSSILSQDNIHNNITSLTMRLSSTNSTDFKMTRALCLILLPKLGIHWLFKKV